MLTLSCPLALRCPSGDSEHGELCAAVPDHWSYRPYICLSQHEHVRPVWIQGECCTGTNLTHYVQGDKSVSLG